MSSCAMRFPGMLSRRPDPAKNVDPVRYGFEMIRIYASTIPAEMVKRETILDRTAQRFIHNAVSTLEPRLVTH